MSVNGDQTLTHKPDRGRLSILPDLSKVRAAFSLWLEDHHPPDEMPPIQECQTFLKINKNYLTLDERMAIQDQIIFINKKATSRELESQHVTALICTLKDVEIKILILIM